jgi:ssDNA-binding Zn-finger/Zn-ribbon topoisomerase 1
MMSSPKDAEYFYFRSEFDKTLKMYFREIIDLSVLPPSLNLNIPVLSCLILLVEREMEIRDFPKSPPKRYTRDSFIDDIDNVGIGVDRVIFDTVTELFSLGFIVENNSEIKPSETAYKIVNFINSLFPGMQGINFIAYLVQTIDEVYSDRKSLAEGKENFYQTLKSRRVKKSTASENALKSLQSPSASEKKGISSKALKERLNQLRKSRGSEKEEVFKKVQVKSVFGSFDKAAKEDEAEQEESVQEEAVQEEAVQKEAVQEEAVQKEAVQKEAVQKEAVQKEAVQEEAVQQEAVQKEAVQKEAVQKEAVQEEAVQEEAVQKEAVQEEAVQEEAVQEEAVQKKAVQEEAVQEEAVQQEKTLSEEEIAKKISMFENELAMTCPVCNEGKIVESETEKGKIFYECTNSLCHFISWAKPFHFSCPSCSNAFLVEEIFPEGSKGLKCPRATCDYQQQDQKNPALSAAPKKKKRVVRRVKRKK